MIRRNTSNGREYDNVPLMSNDDSDNEDDVPSSTRRTRLNFKLGISTIGDRLYSLQRSSWAWIEKTIFKKKPAQERTVNFNTHVHETTLSRMFPQNIIANQKYGIVSFLPKVLYEQFKFFLNLYFLVVAMTQFIPQLRINQWYTYWGPLGFVLAVTLTREAFDDLKRRWRDREINGQKYGKITKRGVVPVKSSDILVGDILFIEKHFSPPYLPYQYRELPTTIKYIHVIIHNNGFSLNNQRIPADVVLLRTSEKTGTCFVRTDQLDGETDWKMRVAVPQTQELNQDMDLLDIGGSVFAEKPQKEIYSFFGTLTCTPASGDRVECPLSIENTMWGNTVLASGTAVGVVVYTGRETRSVLNTSQPRAKVGLLDLEINRLTKVLFLITISISFAVLCLRGFSGPWYLFLLRYVLLFSSIIPISLRVSLDMGKLAYSWHIQRDSCIPDTIVRCSTIPEELGRVEYFLTDKTGTLTKNEMVFKKLAMGFRSFGSDVVPEVCQMVRSSFWKKRTIYLPQDDSGVLPPTSLDGALEDRVCDAVLALVICHNVTPVVEEPTENAADQEGLVDDEEEEVVVFRRDKPDDGSDRRMTYQASSPDEVALVTWTEKVGLTLVKRELTEMEISAPHHIRLHYKILQLFPFTSESKRMGIIVQDTVTGRITLYMKGADSVMGRIVDYTDWLEEECGNLAREGLRILVVGKKDLTEEEYAEFENRYNQAKLSLQDRTEKVAAVMETIERGLQLLCVTGVEDQLQEDVRPSLEMLRNAGIKVWMLTGDKLETAISIAHSSQLVSRHQSMYEFKQVKSRSEAHREIGHFRKKSDQALIISGSSLEVCLLHYESEFIDLVRRCPAVVCCRCSPTHKAQVVHLIKKYTKRPTCAVGDGGNDVSMIQAANVGIGIVGKEGKQASLAADFSITKFKHVGRLLMWHGRNSYKRSSSLSQFVIHRGLIITAMQVVFSVVFYFAAVAQYEGVLMIGYATLYTMVPVYSIVLDEDVTPEDALDFPELYKELMKGRSLSFKTFFTWFIISVYQGSVIMYGSFLLLHDQFLHVVAITFTALIITELVMVGLTVRTWHWLMVVAELFSVVVYVASLAVLSYYFDPAFLLTFEFVWKTLLITSLSIVPLCVLKLVQRRCAPSSYMKLARKNSAFRNCAFWRCRI